MQRYAMRLKRVLGRFAIEVEVETEDGGRRVDVIPRIKMQPKDDEYRSTYGGQQMLLE